jgi:hypothetical protein
MDRSAGIDGEQKMVRMMETWRFLARVAMVTVMVVFLGGTTCYEQEGPQLRYAPGYGYIVEVEQDRGSTYITRRDVIFVPDRSKTFYYIFETEEAARQFIEELKRVAWRLPPYPRRIYALDPEAEKLLKNATTDLPGPLPRATPDVIDRVVPPVPTAPAPQ